MKGRFLLYALLLAAACTRTPSEYVNVWNGTALAGNTYPGATVPFGLVQLSPDNDGMGPSGYRYQYDTIGGFSHTHLSGTGCPDLGDFLITPGIGEAVPLAYSHKDEKGAPGYYKVVFPHSGISAELTATEHVGVHRYRFTGDGERLIRVDANHCIGGWTHASQVALAAEGTQGFSAEHRTSGWALNRDVYLSALFSVPFEKAEEPEPGVLLFTFPADTREITLWAGLSNVRPGNACANREAETASLDFDAVRARAAKLWEEALGAIRVEGGPKDVFYSFFYHTFATPNRMDDVNGEYRDLANENRQTAPGHHYYSTLSLWDTFRTWHPLQTMLRPEMVNDMVNSMLDMYRCRGELPIWPLASDETGCMIGYHSVSVIADAWLRGIRGFDGEAALAAMIESSNKNKSNASTLYNEFGFIPADRKTESVSQTLEMAYDDWCIARMAESLGHQEIAEAYDARALRYRPLFDPVTGFLRGRKADGNWTEPFDPLSGSRDFTEATPWQYRFFVPHDLAGMESLLGGREALYAALDSLFSYAPERQGTLDIDIGGVLGQYAQGNEPGHNLPWLFCWAGKPSRSQEVVRQLLLETYSAAPDGICGNEDCGQMGAWYVMASLGLYPACPGTGEYLLTAPLFKEAEVALGNGKRLIIKADRPKNPYVAEVLLNGEPVRRHFLTYSQIMEGGVLEFKLSARPAEERETLPPPYSLTREAFVSPPSIEGDLVLFPQQAEVTMNCRTPQARIYYTLDGSEPTENSLPYTGPFTVEESCLIRARAFREGLEASPVAFREAHKLFFRPSGKRAGMKSGCRYTYHTANFKLVEQVEPDPPEASGVMREPSILNAPDEDHFAYVFSGYIDIPEDGVWSFSLTSDDGSVLTVEGVPVVNNDGSHGSVAAFGEIPLQKGLHPYKLTYFEDYEGQELVWKWKAPGAAVFSPVPAKVLYY